MLKIALGQLEIKPGHPFANTQKMLLMINEAKRQKAELIVFPAMAVTGSLLGSTLEQPAFLRECESLGQSIIAASEGIAVIFGNTA
ncbi:MAG: NAD(+) synthase, partial [Sporomusaceae bacterium]|nr:NAD(+) synthase [Sporomusaceae bacterium]